MLRKREQQAGTSREEVLDNDSAANMEKHMSEQAAEISSQTHRARLSILENRQIPNTQKCPSGGLAL